MIIFFTKSILAASTPTLVLINNSSTINISVTGADQNAVVMFNYPNASINNSTNQSYTSIDLGQTDSSGSFSVSVAPNSYGLSGGMSVYVSVDGVNSLQMTWPISMNTLSQSGTLSLSQQNIALVVGQSSVVFPVNTQNNLSVQNNSNQSVASVYFQSSNNSVLITALSAGSSTVTLCAGTVGCSSVSISVQTPTQSITFSQSQAYVIAGQPTQTVSIYGGGSGYTLTNSNQNIVSAKLDGNNLTLQSLSLGQAVITVCAPGMLCGSLTVNSVSSGTAVPNQISIPQSASSDFTKPPQLTSVSMSSNNVLGLFFGVDSIININFGVNQTITNVQVKIAGQQSSVNQGTNGSYYTSYKITGNEILPLPVIISYTNPSGLIGQNYFWIGNSATLPTNHSTAISSTTTSARGMINSLTFTQLLSVGSTGSEVKALQQQLKTDGLYAGPITGTYGALTQAAVKKFQTKHGLSQLGIVGPGTRSLLNKGL